jgi:hypothetical protein
VFDSRSYHIFWEVERGPLSLVSTIEELLTRLSGPRSTSQKRVWVDPVSEKWNGVHSASWVRLRSYLEEKVAVVYNAENTTCSYRWLHCGFHNVPREDPNCTDRTQRAAWFESSSWLKRQLCLSSCCFDTGLGNRHLCSNLATCGRFPWKAPTNSFWMDTGHKFVSVKV